jgi:hypothetical protein
MNDINKSRSLELATNRFFKEFLDDDNINEICWPRGSAAVVHNIQAYPCASVILRCLHS